MPRPQFRLSTLLWTTLAMADTRLVPVVLDLVTGQDIDDAIDTGVRNETRAKKVVRLFRQAHEQGAVLSYPDVSLLMHVQTSTVSRTVLEHERATREVIPRRGTVHDMGRSVSHKAIICHKRLVEQKTTSQVAMETHHHPEEVEYYVQCLRRIKLCHESSMSLEEICQATNHSKFLVKECLLLIEELRLPKYAGSCSSC